MTGEAESTVVAAKDQALSTNCFKKKSSESKCQLRTKYKESNDT
jgi:hypothetical protein